TGRVRPAAAASLRALRDEIGSQLDHRAERAAVETGRARLAFAVLVAEAIDSERAGGPSCDTSILPALRGLWGVVREGAGPDALRARLGALGIEEGVRPPTLPADIWKTQVEAVAAALENRAPDLRLAFELHARARACKTVLRAAAYGDAVPMWGRRLRGDHAVELGRQLFRDPAWRRGKLAFQNKPVERIGALCEWGAERFASDETLDDTERASVQGEAVRRYLKRHGYWKPARLGPSEAEAVQELAVRLVRAWQDWVQRYE
ncbi:hypothetical protein, partial [Rubrivirga sp.]|uniref:hypothetical protein n=1 Tax=Rubrivirga sp. TaxID=1885344 RepID=UPI003C7929CD